MSAAYNPTRDRIDYLEAEVARLEEVVRDLTGAGEPHVPGLTPMQSRIIRTLEKANGEMRSHEAVYQACYWDRIGDPPGEKVIGVQMVNIQRRRPDIAQRLESVWGRGYRLVPERSEAQT